jgi:hypothetical protein
MQVEHLMFYYLFFTCNSANDICVKNTRKCSIWFSHRSEYGERYIFWNTKACSLLVVQQLFGGMYFQLAAWFMLFFSIYSILKKEAVGSSETSLNYNCFTCQKLTYFINVLPCNSSVIAVQKATIEESVFSMSAVTSHSGGCCHVTCVSCDAGPFLGCKWQNSFGSRTSQLWVGDRHGKFVVEEEYKKSACEDLTGDLKTLCAL